MCVSCMDSLVKDAAYSLLRFSQVAAHTWFEIWAIGNYLYVNCPRMGT